MGGGADGWCELGRGAHRLEGRAPVVPGRPLAALLLRLRPPALSVLRLRRGLAPALRGVADERGVADDRPRAPCFSAAFSMRICAAEKHKEEAGESTTRPQTPKVATDLPPELLRWGQYFLSLLGGARRGGGGGLVGTLRWAS